MYWCQGLYVLQVGCVVAVHLLAVVGAEYDNSSPSFAVGCEDCCKPQFAVGAKRDNMHDYQKGSSNHGSNCLL